ncbi:hypothetical protein [Shewanella acanthi]|uniref:hypothetical protein n=1 Tax=Shewanella acanthi TaxID=2864212 RepID=UPI001C657310|nr:hypothetical protein [Shewanella acanthi]QYJ77666.1 hypothetical protein K0H61_11015 [Shewanella acanthi]
MSIEGLGDYQTLSNSGAYRQTELATSTYSSTQTLNIPHYSNPASRFCATESSQTSFSETIDSGTIVSETTVTISAAGKQALAAEIGQTLHQQQLNRSEKSAKANETKESEEDSVIDKEIKRIEAQMEALKEMLNKLAGNQSEAAKQQRTQLQQQMMQLSQQLMGLVEQKIREAQQKAPNA